MPKDRLYCISTHRISEPNIPITRCPGLTEKWSPFITLLSMNALCHRTLMLVPSRDGRFPSTSWVRPNLLWQHSVEGEKMCQFQTLVSVLLELCPHPEITPGLASWRVRGHVEQSQVGPIVPALGLWVSPAVSCRPPKLGPWEIISGYCVKTLNFKMTLQLQMPSEGSYEDK